MENNNQKNDQNDQPEKSEQIEGTNTNALDITPINDDVDFENSAIDPGFVRTEAPDPDQKDDALNRGNDRNNGAYNPKNI